MLMNYLKISNWSRILIAFMFFSFIETPYIFAMNTGISPQTQQAADVVQGYLHALQNMDMKNAVKYYPNGYGSTSSSLKPCVKQIQQTAIDNTTWRISNVEITGTGAAQAEVLFDEPDMDALVSEVAQQELATAAISASKSSFENALCENIAHVFAKIPKKKIESLGRKKTTQCFTLTASKNTTHWVIIRQASMHCQEPMAE